MSDIADYTDADLARGRKIARSRIWTGAGSLRENIAVAIAEERAVMRAEMLGRIGRTEAEIARTVEALKRIWSGI